MKDLLSWIVPHTDGKENFATRVEAENGEAAIAAVKAANKGHEAEHAYGDHGGDVHEGVDVVSLPPKAKAN